MAYRIQKSTIIMNSTYNNKCNEGMNSNLFLKQLCYINPKQKLSDQTENCFVMKSGSTLIACNRVCSPDIHLMMKFKENNISFQKHSFSMDCLHKSN